MDKFNKYRGVADEEASRKRAEAEERERKIRERREKEKMAEAAAAEQVTYTNKPQDFIYLLCQSI